MSVWAPPQVVGPKVVVDPRPERQIFVGTGPLALHAEGHIDAEEELAVLKSIENGDAVGRALNVAPRQVYRRRSLLQDAAMGHFLVVDDEDGAVHETRTMESDATAQAGLHFDFEFISGASAGYREAGDQSQYTEEMLALRRRIRHEGTVLEQIRQLWALHAGAHEHEAVTAPEFTEMCVRMCKALFYPREWDEGDARAVAADEWARFLGAQGGEAKLRGARPADEHPRSFEARMAAGALMGFEHFADAVFEIADVWTLDASTTIYAHFLRKLLLRITREVRVTAVHEIDYSLRARHRLEDVFVGDGAGGGGSGGTAAGGRGGGREWAGLDEIDSVAAELEAEGRCMSVAGVDGASSPQQLKRLDRFRGSGSGSGSGGSSDDGSSGDSDDERVGGGGGRAKKGRKKKGLKKSKKARGGRGSGGDGDASSGFSWDSASGAPGNTEAEAYAAAIASGKSPEEAQAAAEAARASAEAYAAAIASGKTPEEARAAAEAARASAEAYAAAIASGKSPEEARAAAEAAAAEAKAYAAAIAAGKTPEEARALAKAGGAHERDALDVLLEDHRAGDGLGAAAGELPPMDATGPPVLSQEEREMQEFLAHKAAKKKGGGKNGAGSSALKKLQSGFGKLNVVDGFCTDLLVNLADSCVPVMAATTGGGGAGGAHFHEKRQLALQHANHKTEEAREARARAKEKLKHAKKKLKAARAMMSLGGKKGMGGMFGKK